MLDVPMHSPDKHKLFPIPPLSLQIIYRVPVTNPDHVLFDNRAFVQIVRRGVCGRSDDLHTPVTGLPIGIGPDEGRQE